MVNFIDLLGVRFATHGRSISEGFDCYGYLMALYKRHGRELPEVDGYKRADDDEFAEHYEEVLKSLRDKVEKVDVPQYSDIVVFSDDKGRMVHIGMALNERDFTHCDIKGSRVSRFREYNKKYEVYRWL